MTYEEWIVCCTRLLGLTLHKLHKFSSVAGRVMTEGHFIPFMESKLNNLVYISLENHHHLVQPTAPDDVHY